MVVSNNTFFFRSVTFDIFQRVLGPEMKEATRMGATLKTIGDEKEAVNNGEENYLGLSNKCSFILCKLSLCIF